MSDHRIDEYKEVGLNLRHYGNMRFAQLSLQIAISGGLLASIFGASSKLNDHEKIVIEAIGLIITAAFYVMERSSTNWWMRYYERAMQIEKEMGFSQYQPRPAKSKLSATNAVRFIFISVFSLWLWLLVANTIRLLHS